MSKGHRSQSEGIPGGQSWHNLINKINNIELVYKSKWKINIHKYT